MELVKERVMKFANSILDNPASRYESICNIVFKIINKDNLRPYYLIVMMKLPAVSQVVSSY